jgi:hypothetical protein
MFQWIKSGAISTLAVPICIFKIIRSPLSSFAVDKNVIVKERTFDSHPLTEIQSLHPAVSTSKELALPTAHLNNNKMIIQPGQYIALKDGLCHYILRGPEEGKLFILLHGISVYSFIWMKLATELNKNGYRVLMFDILLKIFTSLRRDVFPMH